MTSLTPHDRRRLLSRGVLCLVLLVAALGFGVLPTQAQWLRQSFALKAGWNAVYLHVDPSYLTEAGTAATVSQLLARAELDPIQEIWHWAAGPEQIEDLKDPTSPTDPDLWTHWSRTSTANSLTRFQGNSVLLVRSSVDLTWTVTGHPVVPKYRWTTTGLNFIGFPTAPGPSAPSLRQYFDPSTALRQGGEFYTYLGGTNLEPVQISNLAGTRLVRGQAFWVKTKDAAYNRYFSPFEVETPGEYGVRFGDQLSQITVRLRNLTSAPQTVRLTEVASEANPQNPLPHASARLSRTEVPPLLIRGEPLPEFLTRRSAYRRTSEGHTVALAPRGEAGSEVEIVLGCDRTALGGNPGDLRAGILRFKDDGDLAQIDVPVSVRAGSNQGLWVGNAMITNVAPVLTSYHTATDSAHFTNLVTTEITPRQGENGIRYVWDAASGRILAFGGGDPQLKLSDLSQPRELIVQLKAAADPVSQFLTTEGLSPTARAALTAWEASSPEVPNPLLIAVLEDLNALIVGTSLWPSDHFTNVAFRAETQGLAARTNLVEWERRKLHRLLLEDTYPGAISRQWRGERTGNYVSKTPVSAGEDVPRFFPLRLIVHQDTSSTVRLLQKVHHGPGPDGQPILTTRPDRLKPGLLKDARRISAAHLPIAPNNAPWDSVAGGSLAPSNSVQFTVTTDYQDIRANPFLHRHHPDHDNRTATLPPGDQPVGEESFRIQRKIRLHRGQVADDFESRTRATTALEGRYEEEMTLVGRGETEKTFRSGGVFHLERISDVAELQ